MAPEPDENDFKSSGRATDFNGIRYYHESFLALCHIVPRIGRKR